MPKPAASDTRSLHSTACGLVLILATVSAGFMFTGAALVSGAGDGEVGMLEGLIIEKLNGWDIEKR